MEISEVKPTERLIEIVHPKTGENIGIKVGLLSIDDPKLKNVKRKIQDERLRIESKGKALKSDDLEENTMSMLFTAITSWEWGKNPETGDECLWKGEKPELNLKNLKEIMTELPWFRTQIEQEIQDESAFF